MLSHLRATLILLAATLILGAAGARADSDHRLGWVSLEPDRSGVLLTCERWPENERLVLATSSPHGTNVTWQPAPSPAGSLS